MCISPFANEFLSPCRVSAERNPERWNPNNPHPFHFPSFASLAERGAIFDQYHPWKSFIPTIIHVAMIFTLNSTYRNIAEMLTEWENHETEDSFRNSLVLKRFLFEAFDCYVALFYLAFYERDVDRLHMELKTVFNIDTFRRLTMECFIPLGMQKFQKWTGRAPCSKTANRSAMMTDDSTTSDDEVDSDGAHERRRRKPRGSTSADSPASVITASTASTAIDEEDHLGDTSKINNATNNAAGFSTLRQLAEEADKDEYVSFFFFARGFAPRWNL